MALAALALVVAGWRWGPEAWARSAPWLEATWEAGKAKAMELWSAAQATEPEIRSGAQELTLEIVLPVGVVTTRAKVRLIPRGGEATTLEFERTGNGRYRLEMVEPRDPARPVAVGVGFESGKTRKYRWRCEPAELGDAFTLDVGRARAGEGCWEEIRERE
jgi:hypothetical protein